MTFDYENFMLHSDLAKDLFHNHAKDQAIIDYHCHLDPKEIAEDHEFENITELWLGGDHYKWRVMRANGIPEEKITGNASPEEKFKAWAESVEIAVGNPVQHWTWLELHTYFGIDEMLTSKNWKEIYDECNRIIKEEGLTARTLIKNSNVELIGTTDNPTDSLEYHKQIAEDDSFDVKVLPSFRPDEYYDPSAEGFKDSIANLSKVSGVEVTDYTSLLEALENRVDFFHDHGTVASDHGVSVLKYAPYTEAGNNDIFAKGLAGEKLSHEEEAAFQTGVLVELSKMYADREWAMQIHFGAIRNNNPYGFENIGRDAGFDSIGDQTRVAYNLNGLLGEMAKTENMPRVIVYNLDPNVNDVVASACANFQMNNEGIKSKVQFGSGWWFNDTDPGMHRQIETLQNHGVLYHFVGMLTDSRSFISYIRHDYFRRILCNFIAEQVHLGKYPDNKELLAQMVENISYNNAKNYFVVRD